MDSQNPSNSEIAKGVQNMSLSRRRGVRTRGGRLPPISMRDIAQVTGAKKVVAPKIPQRRAVKKENIESEKRQPLIKTEAKDDSRGSRGRGRGRGSAVIVQTEGTFLADGPALRIKREAPEYETFSMPRRSAAASTRKYDIKRNPEALKDLITSDSSDEDDDSTSIPGRCFPPLDLKKIPKVKLDPETENIKMEIKKEPLDDEDIKPVIKTEPKDYWNALEGKFFSKIEMDIKEETKSAIEEFSNVKDKGQLILLQIPDCLPFTIDSKEDTSKDDKEKGASKPPPSFIESLPEGFVGKLQIFKSGKKRLVLGGIAFDVTDGIDSSAMKEVVSIRMHDDGGDIAVLGQIEKKMVLRPDIEQLVKEAVPKRGEDCCSDFN